ncbi:helix-turn-helix transcriptional regulator [Actinocrinis puniceicyclus]|uniref:Helix-turn-helix transcriptional regulator n=2 Tax=Actinocrinis puniceicyclus TaxID=977794 RepID=A0A8J7WJS8_9ACTN|nr:helix-turn-helix transcriptional regulator [Actinocrinis puniceicyclus]
MKPHGPAIRAIREAKGIGIRQLSATTGLHRGYLSRVETGEVGASDETISRIAVGLDVPIEAVSYAAPQASTATIRRIVQLLGSSPEELDLETAASRR